ncbi:MAG: class I SAM-dependent methyltransferase [Alphaproteobacteria bacterium]
MSGFSADWLTLRAAHDDAARCPTLARAFVRRLPANPHLVDLGAGTGAARRALDPLLRGRARWTLVDADAALLRLAVRDGGPGRSAVRARRRGLAGPLRDLLAGADGVTAFAFLDLVSPGWIARLAEALAGLPFYAPLVVDGGVDWRPVDPDDGLVDRLFLAHQHRHKGFGPALGPSAPGAAATLFRRAGCRFRTAPSDWVVTAADPAMLAALVDGAAGAAAEQSPAERARIAAWGERRRAAIAVGRLSVRVGHRDLLAWRSSGNDAGA